MLKQSHYKVGCDAHKHYSVFAVFDSLGSSFERTRVNHERGAIRTFLSQLPPGTPVALETVGNWYWIVDEIDVVADMGYYDGQEVKACLEERITPYIPKANTSANRKRGLFTKEDFRYDREQDCYGCPADQALTYRFTTVEQDREIRYYATRACGHCPIKAQCTRNQRGRRITRWVDEHLLEAMQARVQAEPEKVKLRKQLA